MASPLWRSSCSQLYKTYKLNGLNSFRSPITASVVKRCTAEISKRGMASSGGRKIVISPSRFEWTRFKNDAHFYIMLTGLPLGAIIFYCNFILGEAELAEIPEGYEPKPWEYYKHPISRWFAKYVYEDPVKLYEMEATKQVQTFEAARHRAQKHKVKDMMKNYDDYRAYYFLPAIDPRYTEKLRKDTEYIEHYEAGTR